MNNKDINLKHGYILLSSILLVLFAISLSVEIYLKGGFNTVIEVVEKQISEETNNPVELEPTIELISLKNGYTTKESSISVVAKTEGKNKAYINEQEVSVNENGIFELKVELAIGNNDVLIEVINSDDVSNSLVFSIIREEENNEETKTDETKPESIKSDIPKDSVIPETPKSETPTNTVTPEPVIVPKPLTGLKLSCSITNTRPSVGQTVTLDCMVKDQDENGVSGATSNTTLNWQSGQHTYSFPVSVNGSTKVSFTVPDGNSGSVSGIVKLSKSGLTITSNFSIIVQ